MKIAIITGASSGLGEKLLYETEKRFSLDEIWIIARRKERLEALAAKCTGGAKIVPIALDLTDYSSYETLSAMLAEKKPEIFALLNNAGFGKLGNMIDMTYPEQAGMVDLNCRALTAVTTLCLPYMKKRAGGEKVSSFILNTCSIASFAPNPRMTVYCSTKAYVLSFTKSLRFELRGTGINVCAVCPGPMATEFLDVAGISGGKSKTFETLPYCDPGKVAAGALKAASAGRNVYTPRAFFKFYRFLAKILPHSLVMKMSKT